MKLLDALEILRQPAQLPEPPLKVLLACGFTPLHLQTFLAAHLKLQTGRAIAMETGLFGDCLGCMESADQTACESTAVALEWSDFDPRLGLRQLGGWRPGDFADILATASARAERFADAIERAAKGMSVAVCMPTLPLPPIDFAPGWRAGGLNLELHAIAAAFAVRIGRQPRVRIVNRDRLDQLSPIAERRDPRMELASGFPYRPGHAAVVAELLALLLGSPSPKKGIITDLDDTLWAGLVGEIGPESVAWDLDRHAQMHGLYQQLLAGLADAGILIGVASKNDSHIAESALARPDLAVPRKCLFPLEIHWQAKSASVGRILDAWNLGADSVVFVDDSPMELAEVQAAFPEMECLLFPSRNDADAYRLLERLRDLFGKDSIRAEDRLRRDSLRPIANLGADPDSLLRDAAATLSLSFAKEPFDARALELVNKTNQFNLNGRRFTEGAWLHYLARPETAILIASYRDKFGPLGTIAVLSGRTSGQTFVVETWVMSCRAFARRIEHRCLEAVFEQFGVSEVEFEFAATERNRPMRDFLAALLGRPASRGDCLSEERFRACCPALYHQIEVNEPCTIPSAG